MMTIKPRYQPGTAKRLIEDSLLNAETRMGPQGLAHIYAWACPKGIEKPVYRLVQGIAEYIDEFHAIQKADQDTDYKCIADDGYAGPYVLDMLKALRKLLSSHTGRFDCGTLDSLIVSMAELAGFNTRYF